MVSAAAAVAIAADDAAMPIIVCTVAAAPFIFISDARSAPSFARSVVFLFLFCFSFDLSYSFCTRVCSFSLHTHTHIYFRARGTDINTHETE